MAKKSKPSPKKGTNSNKKSSNRPPVKKKVVNTVRKEKKAANSASTQILEKKARPLSRKAQAMQKKKVVQQLPFGKMNYLFLGIGVAVIALGFYLMSLEGFIDAQEFSIALDIAPIIVMSGFIGIIFAIMYKQKPQNSQSQNTLALDMDE